MGSAGLSSEIKIANPLERSIVADLSVAAMGGVVRGRIDVENLAIQLISDSARYAVQQSYANSWARLESGNFTETDIQLLRHETAEAWYMRRNGPGYTAAHNAADARYPAPDLENMLENLNGLNP